MAKGSGGGGRSGRSGGGGDAGPNTYEEFLQMTGLPDNNINQMYKNSTPAELKRAYAQEMNDRTPTERAKMQAYGKAEDARITAENLRLLKAEKPKAPPKKPPKYYSPDWM